MRSRASLMVLLCFALAGCGDDSQAGGDGGTSDPECFSPTQHVADAYEAGSKGCACDAKHDEGMCVNAEGRDVALVCDDATKRWIGVEDGPCEPHGKLDAGVDAGGDGGPSCEERDKAFDTFVVMHQACEKNSDCAVIGDCSPNADFRAVQASVADEAYDLMQARCSGASDGPGFDAVCTNGKCALEENPDECCGCWNGDAGL